MRTPKGMKRWLGGECAPIDWAGPKSRTMLRSGIIVWGGYRWTHCNDETPAGTAVTDIVVLQQEPTMGLLEEQLGVSVYNHPCHERIVRIGWAGNYVILITAPHA